MHDDFIPCSVKSLPMEQLIPAAQAAIQHNPANRPHAGGEAGFTLEPMHLALLTSKYFGSSGVRLTVGFPFDSTPADLQARIVQHMNAWADYAKVVFMLTSTEPQVRIARTPGQGYYSYLGTDVLQIPRNQPTMNLDSFTMNTPESEFHRVVRHETGHTIGCPHEHMRRELVQRLDVQKTIAYFQRTQGWSAQVTRQQVLTPLEEASIRGTPTADQDSIMCYALPGSITIDGQPIRGGVDIDPLDQQFIATLYPREVTPPQPPPSDTTIFVPKAGTYRLVP